MAMSNDSFQHRSRNVLALSPEWFMRIRMLLVVAVLFLAGGMFTGFTGRKAPVAGKGLPWTAPSSVPFPSPIEAVASVPLTSSSQIKLTGVGGWISTMRMFDGALLVVSDSGVDGQVSIVDTSSGQVAGSGLPKAVPREGLRARLAALRDGRNRTVVSLASDPRDPRTVWAFDVVGHRFIKSSLSSDHRQLIERGQIVLGSRGVLSDPAWFGTRVLSAGFLSRGQLLEFDDDGYPTRLLGAPAYDMTATSMDLHYHVNFARMTGNEVQGKVAVAYEIVPRLDIVSTTGEPVRRLVWPTPYDFPVPTPIYAGKGEPRFAFRKGARNAFLDVTSTKTHIFALYSGVPFAGGADNAFELGRTVLRLRWDGTLDGHFTLDSAAHAIAVSDDGAILYTSTMARAPIRVYKLASALGASEVAAR